MNTWIISDTHFEHRNIITFKDKDGNLTRPFKSVEEMDELMIENWNNLIKPKDRVYHLGDFCINRKAIKIAERLNGRICLIKGNHDIFKLKDYIPYFDDIRSYQVFPKHKIIFSHYPVHSVSLKGKNLSNVHGHLHQNIIEDNRYINVCVEHTNYKPISFDELLEKVNKLKEKQYGF